VHFKSRIDEPGKNLFSNIVTETECQFIEHSLRKSTWEYGN